MRFERIREVSMGEDRERVSGFERLLDGLKPRQASHHD